ncbi:MAG TPA: choice-of-anchor tandem repeat GloVer-containing protein [Verrucomicrobiae bacterium]|nr:choice-of-anchor tandem repeat GloVer-containing protein [Verrucomicrobiae bacterium]
MHSFQSVSTLSVRTLTFAILAIAAVIAIACPLASAQYRILYSFTGKADGGNPYSPLIRNSQGDLLGTTEWGGHVGPGYGVFFKLRADGTETVLHTFENTDGKNPIGRIAQDSAGNFYGTTLSGGANLTGTLYKMDKTGNLTTLISLHPSIGRVPEGGLILDAEGNLYGTDATDGGPRGTATTYDGVVFKFSNTNVYTELYRFTAPVQQPQTTDGLSPGSSLLRDSLGNLYGTTSEGGNYRCVSGCGTVFKLSPTGVEKVMHRFAGRSKGDGGYPQGGLIRDSAGNFYGTTAIGGSANQGTIYKMDTTDKVTILYSFQGGTDGSQPWGNLVMDSSGNLYGTTSAGGDLSCTIRESVGCGIVFKLDPSGVETILHSFAGMPADGAQPLVGLTLGSDGNLYGTTLYGGPSNAGTIFEIAP